MPPITIFVMTTLYQIRPTASPRLLTANSSWQLLKTRVCWILVPTAH